MDKLPKLPIVSQIKTLAKTKCFNIEQLSLEFSNGQQRVYERLKGSAIGAVLVVPMLDNDTALMIYEYSGGTQRYELGCVKGKIDIGETPLQAANRELAEEIGYQASQLTLLKTVTLAPGYQANTTHLILARGLSTIDMTQFVGDEPEPLIVVKRSLAQLDNWVHEQAITESRSITALYLVKSHLAKNSN